MPFAFAFHYAPEALDEIVLDEILAWCTDAGPLEAAFDDTWYVPRGQTKLRIGGPYRRASVLARIEDPKVDTVLLRARSGRADALLVAGGPIGLTAPWHQVVLILDETTLTGGDAVALAYDLVVQCPPLAAEVEHFDTHSVAEAVMLGAFDDMLAPTVMAAAARTVKNAPAWGPKVRGPGWLTYLSAPHFEALGESGVRALGQAAWALHPADQGALIQSAPTPGATTDEIRAGLEEALRPVMA